MEQGTCFEDKSYFEVPLAKVLKFRPYRKLLFCIYLMILHEDITPNEIRQKLNYIGSGWWLGRAMVLGSFQCRGVLLLLHIVGQGPAVPAAGAARVGYIFFYFSSVFHS